MWVTEPFIIPAVTPPTGVLFDAKGVGSPGHTFQSGGTSLTGGFGKLTVGTGSNRALVVTIVYNFAVTQPGGFSVVWDSGGANQTVAPIISITSGHGNFTAAMYGLVAPVSGAKILTVSWTNAVQDFFIDAISFTNVDQTGSTTTFSNATSVDTNGSLLLVGSVTSQVGGMVVSCGQMSPSPGAGGAPTGTSIFSDGTSGGFINAMAEYDAGASPTKDIGWTSPGAVTLEPMVACNIKAF